MKWRPDHKREEMRSPGLRYIVVREAVSAEAPTGDGGVDAEPLEEGDREENGTETQKEVDGDADEAGHDDAQSTTTTTSSASSPTIPAFTSLMPVYEEGEPVVYCYEIHLSPALQGSGLGRLLLGFQSIVAHNIGPPVSKVMLTCFLSNARALRFYERQGFETDPLAPTTRRLRGGKVFVPDYTILSKPVVR